MFPVTATVSAGDPDPCSGFRKLQWVPALSGHEEGGTQDVEMLLPTLQPLV